MCVVDGATGRYFKRRVTPVGDNPIRYTLLFFCLFFWALRTFSRAFYDIYGFRFVSPAPRVLHISRTDGHPGVPEVGKFFRPQALSARSQQPLPDRKEVKQSFLEP